MPMFSRILLGLIWAGVVGNSIVLAQPSSPTIPNVPSNRGIANPSGSPSTGPAGEASSSGPLPYAFAAIFTIIVLVVLCMPTRKS